MSATRGPRRHFHPSEAVPARWQSNGAAASPDPEALRAALADVRTPVVLVQTADGPAVAKGGSVSWGDTDGLAVLAVLPAMHPSSLGDPAFCADHGLRFPYVTGGMANGIASAELVEAIGSAGMLGFFGAAGLSLDRIETAILQVKQTLGDRPFGFNLIHSPAEQAIESGTVDLYLRHGVQLAEASAYFDLTPHVVRYRLIGIRRAEDGRVVTPNRLVAKVSRVEVASKFFAPAPEKIIR
ncbi:MAG TPA: nitronate monooxygenase, partial [Gemmataceae bacterium]|nr:nitronate monooxygenase [Gemmataceae bacterium]